MNWMKPIHLFTYKSAHPSLTSVLFSFVNRNQFANESVQIWSRLLKTNSWVRKSPETPSWPSGALKSPVNTCKMFTSQPLDQQISFSWTVYEFYYLKKKNTQSTWITSSICHFYLCKWNVVDDDDVVLCVCVGPSRTLSREAGDEAGV